MKQVEGYWFPEALADKCANAYLAKHVQTMEVAVKNCFRTRTAFVAGDSFGVWTAKLAKIFNWVITMEPHTMNFECLVKNTEGMANVIRLQACCGHKGRPLELKNVKVKDHWIVGQGKIPQLKVDYIDQTPFDLFMFNVGGYEYYCLQGASKTIDMTHPVVVYEDHHKWKTLHDKPHKGPADFLKKKGYETVTTVNGQVIWKMKNRPEFAKDEQ